MNQNFDEFYSRRIKKSNNKPGWWFGTFFPYIGNFIIPIDELIFVRGVGIPSDNLIYLYIYIAMENHYLY